MSSYTRTTELSPVSELIVLPQKPTELVLVQNKVPAHTAESKPT